MSAELSSSATPTLVAGPLDGPAQLAAGGNAAAVAIEQGIQARELDSSGSERTNAQHVTGLEPGLVERRLGDRDLMLRGDPRASLGGLYVPCHAKA